MKLHQKLAIGIIMASSLVSCVGHQDQENLSTKSLAIQQFQDHSIPAIQSGLTTLSDDELYQSIKNELLHTPSTTITFHAVCYDRQGYILDSFRTSVTYELKDFDKITSFSEFLTDLDTAMASGFEYSSGRFIVSRRDHHFWLQVIINPQRQKIADCGFQSPLDSNVINTQFLNNLLKFNSNSGAIFN